MFCTDWSNCTIVSILSYQLIVIKRTSHKPFRCFGVFFNLEFQVTLLVTTTPFPEANQFYCLETWPGKKKPICIPKKKKKCTNWIHLEPSQKVIWVGNKSWLLKCHLLWRCTDLPVSQHWSLRMGPYTYIYGSIVLLDL